MDDTTRTGYDAWIGNDVVDSSDQKIGKVSDIFYDDQTHRPEWVAVKTGLFGSNDTFVPLHGSMLTNDGHLQVPYPKDFVKDAPNVVEGSSMTAQEEAELWSYYGYDHADAAAINAGYGTDYRTTTRADADYGYSRFDRNTEAWGEERREHEEVVAEATAVSEQAAVSEVPETVRLRKYRHTEMVPVTKEEIRVEKDDATATPVTGDIEAEQLRSRGSS